MSHTVPLSVRIDAQLYQRIKEVCVTHGIRRRTFIEDALRRVLEELPPTQDRSYPEVDLSTYMKAYADHLRCAIPYGPEDAAVARELMAGLKPFLEVTNEQS